MLADPNPINRSKSPENSTGISAQGLSPAKRLDQGEYGSLTQFNQEAFPSREGLTTIPSGMIVLAPNQVIDLSADAAVVDVDETQIAGSGIHVHDGFRGRFALALSELLNERLNLGAPINSLFFEKESDWHPFQALAGLSELSVCENMAALANSMFLPTVNQVDHITGAELMARSHDVLEQQWEMFADRVKPVDGIANLLKQAQLVQVRLGICSASCGRYVTRIMDHFQLSGFYEKVEAGADKKVSHNVFNGASISKVLADMGVAAANSVMIGDSISDYAAAALAGVPVVVLRLPDDAASSALTQIISQINAWRSVQGKDLTVDGTALLIIRDFSQLRFKMRNQSSPTTSTHYVIYDPLIN